MKASDKPEISKKWWLKEKPADIKGKELEGALADCEKALADANKKKDDEDTIKAALESLESLSEAVDKTIKKECDKKKHKDLITVLGKYEDVIGDETKRLEKSQDASENEEDEDEEDEKGILKPEYLDRMIKKLRSGNQLQFCFGLNKQSPADSRLLLCNKRKPERLHKVLKQTGDFSNRLMTFGTCTGEGKVMEFNLSDDAKEPSQIVKLAKLFLKGHKDLKYRKIRVIAGGQTFEEDTEEGEEGRPPDRRAGSEESNGSTRSSATGAADQQSQRKQFVQARSKWMKVRNKAEQDLEAVKDGIRNHYIDDVEQYPIAVKKLKELDDIFENLSHDLRDALDQYVHTPLNKKDKLQELATSARQLVDTFADYVEASPLLTAIDQKEFADVQIKGPLSAALRELEKTLA